jgi:hypothetical protein
VLVVTSGITTTAAAATSRCRCCCCCCCYYCRSVCALLHVRKEILLTPRLLLLPLLVTLLPLVLLTLQRCRCYEHSSNCSKMMYACAGRRVTFPLQQYPAQPFHFEQFQLQQFHFRTFHRRGPALALRLVFAPLRECCSCRRLRTCGSRSGRALLCRPRSRGTAPECTVYNSSV